MREFHLGDILSITHERILSPEGVGGIYKILNYMTSDKIWTNQIPRVADECKPYLLAEMPWIKEIDDSTVNRGNWKMWLAEMTVKYGEYHAVRPIHGEDHEVIDPYQELLNMGIDEDRIIIVAPDDPVPPEGDVNWKVE